MDALNDVAELFRLLSHPSRLAILEMLRHGEECVCHMTAMMGARQSYVSQQLMVLREAGLVTDRRDGWNVYYHVTRPEVYAVLDAARNIVPDERAALPAFILENRSDSCPCPKCQGAIAA